MAFGASTIIFTESREGQDKREREREIKGGGLSEGIRVLSNAMASAETVCAECPPRKRGPRN